MPPESPERILAVGSDPVWQKLVKKGLEGTSHSLRSTDSAQAAIALAEKEMPDLVLVDLVLLDGTGLALCRSVRESDSLRDLPVIFVSSHADETNRILAFEVGADDFLPIPFFSRELRARIRAVFQRTVRRRAARTEPRVVSEGPLVVDGEHGTARLDGRDIDLTRTELQILVMLASAEGRVLSRRQILAGLGVSEGRDSERAVDAHVKAIRRKLGRLRSWVETVRGRGYRFVGEPGSRAGTADPREVRRGGGPGHEAGGAGPNGPRSLSSAPRSLTIRNAASS